MSNSLNDVRTLWECCLLGTMYYRNKCASRPPLYFTDAGSLILDCSRCSNSDTDLVNLIFGFCDFNATRSGFILVCSHNVTGLDIWQKGGTA